MTGFTEDGIIQVKEVLVSLFSISVAVACNELLHQCQVLYQEILTEWLRIEGLKLTYSLYYSLET